MVQRFARNGGLLFFCVASHDVAVAVINPRLSVLLVLNVHPDHRHHGLGSAILTFLCPNWVRSVQHVAPWFERHGYVRVGSPKQGRRYLTQIMVRRTLLTLAGRISASHATDAQQSHVTVRDAAIGERAPGVIEVAETRISEERRVGQ
jgi:GNAT superfamily N-acetyltransferase